MSQNESAPATVQTVPVKPVGAYASDAARIRLGMTCGKCGEHHAAFRCPEAD